MCSRPSLPDHPVLAEVARALAATRQAASLFDNEWRLTWVSDDLKVLVGEEDEGKLGYGKHVIEAYLSDVWAGRITPESQITAFFEEFPYIVHDTPGGKAAVRELLRQGMSCFPPAGAGDDVFPVDDAALDSLMEALEPAEPPIVHTTTIDFIRAELPPTPIVEVMVRLHDDSGFLGTAAIYMPALPARVMDLLTRGDERMLDRMVRLFNPGRRRAAVLFADLQASGQLSRRLPSAAYFNLIRGITTAIDEVVVNHEGIVGKHAGDGVTAFFLADDLGSSSAAAGAAVRAGRAIAARAGLVAQQIADETGVVTPDDCLINVGLHWGGTLYMGQLITGGRLEVTALGDEVNECARIQETAQGGEVLASKSLIEHLDHEDAVGLDLDPDAVRYRTIAELPGAGEKARRDAGGLPVTPV